MDDHNALINYPRPELTQRFPAAIERRSIAPQQLSIADICRTVAKRKGLILGVTAFVLCAVVAYIFLKTPMYEGVARLQIDPTRSTSLGLEDDRNKLASNIDVDGRIKTEVTIIQSDTVALQVMKSLQLYTDPKFAGKDAVHAPINDLSELSPSQRRKLLERFRDDLTVKTVPATQTVVLTIISGPGKGAEHRLSKPRPGLGEEK